MEEKEPPKGLSLLHHSKTIQTYLSLLSLSQKDATLEACCGALQNLTANKSAVRLAKEEVAQSGNKSSHCMPLWRCVGHTLPL